MSGLGRRMSYICLSLILGFAVSASGLVTLFIPREFYVARAFLSSFAANALPFLVLARPFRVSPDSFKTAVRKPKLMDLLLLSALALALCVSCSVFPDFISAVMKADGGEYAFNPLDYITLALIPAVIEEWSFRKIIAGGLLKYGSGFAVFVSSALFALSHTSLTAVLYAFLCGVLLGCLYVRARSLFACVSVHFFCNAFSVSLNALESRTPYYIALAASAVLSAAIFTILRIRKTEISPHEPKTTKAAFGTAFKNPLAIAVFAAYIIRIAAAYL